MNAIGIILAGGRGDNLKELTRHRTTSALPVGSCYRAIDFPISNMTNSGIKKIAIITQYNSRSLQDHLASAKWWNLGRKQGGLFVLAPCGLDERAMWYRGTADSIHQNISFLKRSQEEYVVVSSGNCIYKMDFAKMLEFHIEKDADITIAYREDTAGARRYGVLVLDESQRMLDFEEKPLDPKSSNASTGVYIMRRELLIEKMEELVADGRYDLVRDLFTRYRKRLQIYGYPFDGHWRSIYDIRAYYDCNMEFLKSDIRKIYTSGDHVIHTKPKDEPPAKFNATATVKNSLVASGSIFDGQVENSVVFRSVRVGVDSTVADSILMEGTKIKENCTIEYAILDKDVVIENGVTIKGLPNNPLIIPKGEVVTSSVIKQ